MIKRKELCDLNKKSDSLTCIALLNQCFREAEYRLVNMVPHYMFVDMDQVYTDKHLTEALIKLLAEKVRLIAKSEAEFNKIAFIRKGRTTGLIPILGEISNRTRYPIVIIRSDRRIADQFVKGETRKGDKFLIISDVSDTGVTIHGAVDKVFDLDSLYGREMLVSAALAVFDWHRGARENLERYVDFFCLFSMKRAYNILNKEFVRRYKKGIYPNFEPNYIDFGFKSVTIFRRLHL
jgi:orotate phosphoribosyltransferase